MCEDPRYKLADVICVICVVEGCDMKEVKTVHGCEFGKPSNEALRWAFAFTNQLKSAGLPKHKCKGHGPDVMNPAKGMPEDPTDKQIDSACMFLRHDFGLLSEDAKNRIRYEAKEWLRAWLKAGILMPDMKCSSKMAKEEIQKVETPLEKGPSHIVQSLVGIYGSTGGEVINTIVKNWMDQNIEMLESYGISLKVVGGVQVLQKYNEADHV